MGIRDRPTSPRSPWQNAYAERLIGSIRRECLDHVVVFGERHLRHVLLSYLNYYNETRTHLSQGSAPIAHGSESRAYSSPSNPGRAASPMYSDLICDRHRGSAPSGTHLRTLGSRGLLGQNCSFQHVLATHVRIAWSSTSITSMRDRR
jgi:hypothetical protein